MKRIVFVLFAGLAVSCGNSATDSGEENRGQYEQGFYLGESTTSPEATESENFHNSHAVFAEVFNNNINVPVEIKPPGITGTVIGAQQLTGINFNLGYQIIKFCQFSSCQSSALTITFDDQKNCHKFQLRPSVENVIVTSDDVCDSGTGETQQNNGEEPAGNLDSGGDSGGSSEDGTNSAGTGGDATSNGSGGEGTGYSEGEYSAGDSNDDF